MSRNRINILANSCAFILLFSGYILTTGLEIISPEIYKTPFRLMAVSASIVAIAALGAIPLHILFVLISVSTVLVFNLSPLTVNVIFVLTITIGASHLTREQLSKILAVTAWIAAGIHLVALVSGASNFSSVEVGDRIRFTLGFANANQMAILYSSLAIASLYAHSEIKSNFSFAQFIAGQIISCVALILSDSRTNILIIAAALATFFAIKVKVGVSAARLAATILPVVAGAITFFIALTNTEWLNKILSNRPYYFSEFIINASAVDYIVGWQPNPEVPIDNAYLLLLSCLGAPLLAIFILLALKRIRKAHPNNLIGIIPILLGSIFESFAVRPEIPLASMLFIMLLSNRINSHQHAAG